MGELLEVGRRLLGDAPTQAPICRTNILTWASRLSEQDVESPEPVAWAETRLRTVASKRISWYAGRYLRAVIEARFGQTAGSWEPWTPDWLAEREREAMEALENLRQALEGPGVKE